MHPSPPDPPESVLAHLLPLVQGTPFPERRLGRVFAFITLYEAELARHQPAQVIDRLAEAAGEPGLPVATVQSAAAYAREVVQGVLAQRHEIDAILQERAPTWPLAHMSAIDRNVLRIGLYETRFSNAKVPLRAAINEAVELAKLFGSETSGKFVNGVLGRAVA